MLLQCIAEEPVELVRRHLDPAMTDDLKRRGHDRPDPLLGLRGHHHHGRERGEFEVFEQRLAPVGRATVCGFDEVDLVDDDDQTLSCLERVAGDVLVLCKDPRRGIDDEQHSVRTLHRVDSAHEAVALEAVAVRRLLPDPGRVDENHRDVVVDQLRVDRVAGRPRSRAHQRTLIAEQGIEQG